VKKLLAIALLLILAAAVSAATKPIVLVKGTNTLKTDSREKRSITTFSETVAKALRLIGVDFEWLGDEDVEQGKLAGAKLAIFCYSPNMSAQEAQAAIDFIEQGGKVFQFYSIPGNLLEALGIQRGSWPAPQGRENLTFCRRVIEGVPDLPEQFRQDSWFCRSVEPKAHNAQIWYAWNNGEQDTAPAAVIVSDRGGFMGHVLTANDLEQKSWFLLALVTKFAPSVRRQSMQNAIAQIGQVGAFQSLEEVEAAVNASQAGDAKKAAAALAQARELRDKAKQFAAADKFREVAETCREASRAAMLAYAECQRSKRSEFRAVWIHTAYGVKDWGWEKSIRRLKEMGFNAIVPNMWRAGSAEYNSKLIPVSDRCKTEGDQITECLKWCKKYGIECHPWKVNWNLSTAPDWFLDKLRQEGRLQKDPEGQEIKWLCPSHPENQKLEVESMLEVALNYDVDGVHFDYIRYPSSKGCYCEGCHKRFQEDTGIQVQDWPGEVLRGPKREPFLAWRAEQITRVVREVYRRAHKAKPHIKISAAVFGSWLRTRESIGQDTLRWINEGYLDFVCPMDYTSSNRSLTKLTTLQVAKTAAQIPLYIGIGDWRLKDGAQLIDQINIARRLGADGFILFHYDNLELADNRMPLLRAGITEQDAVLPHHAPQARIEVRAAEGEENVFVVGSKLSLSARLDAQSGVRGKVEAQMRRTDGTVVAKLGQMKSGPKKEFSFTSASTSGWAGASCSNARDR